MKQFFKNHPIIYHLSSWFIMAFVFFIIFPFTYRVALPKEHYIYHAILLLFLILFYYLNTRLLLPKIEWKKNGFLYVFTLTILTFFLLFLMNQIEEILQLNLKIHRLLHPNQINNNKQNTFFISIYISIFCIIVFGVGTTLHLIKSWRKEEKKKLILNEQKTKAELQMLKAQINPHFFFNTLNTIYSLTYFDVEKSRFALQKMAKMMRFVLNEEQNEKVLLNDEVVFIENYIELMRFRIPENVNLVVNIHVKKTELLIAPMLLLTFIENAFQHGISTSKDCEINLKLKLQNCILILETKNEIFENKKLNRSKNVGVLNTLRRLEIVYPSRYQYEALVNEKIYECNLKINLE